MEGGAVATPTEAAVVAVAAALRVWRRRRRFPRSVPTFARSLS